jgi:hypothetical protein
MPHPNWRIEARRIMRQNSQHEFTAALTAPDIAGSGRTSDLCSVCGAKYDHRNHLTGLAEIIQFPGNPNDLK